jgi:RimJ/RimL family protein N-acetyltransferase
MYALPHDADRCLRRQIGARKRLGMIAAAQDSAKAVMIEFAALASRHIPLLHRWLNQGEALKWYGRRPQSEADLRLRYLVDKPRSGTHAYVIRRDAEPIGYLQHYRLADYPEYARLIGAAPGDHGLDLFIGRDDLLGRGLGTAIVTAALDQLIFSQPAAQRCLVGPSPENERAIRCYARCGFRHERTVSSPEGEQEYVMVLERPSRSPRSATA